MCCPDLAGRGPGELKDWKNVVNLANRKVIECIAMQPMEIRICVVIVRTMCAFEGDAQWI